MIDNALANPAPFCQLRIVQQPPESVFSDEWFCVGLDLSSSYPPGILRHQVELCADLYKTEKEGVLSQPAQCNGDVELHLTGQPGVHDSSCVTEVRCMIKSHVNKSKHPLKYSMKFFYRLKENHSTIVEVDSACSRPIHIVNSRLKLDCDWDSIFYKDEGGRDKCLHLTVRLCGRDDSVMKGRHVPLRVTLLYDNNEGTEVMKQSETLRIIGPRKQFIDPDSGESTILFRIEDVSKNHQGNKFKVRVAPDGSRVFDVAAAWTPAIIVRSKRNKRQKSPARRKVKGDELKPDRYVQTNALQAPFTAFQNHHTPERKKSKQEEVDVKTALNQVSEWTKEVIGILPSLKWNVIGYCQKEDGSIDYTRPNHVMPYPNNCISKILTTFKDETIQNLSIVHDAIDRLDPSLYQTSLSPKRQENQVHETSNHLFDPYNPVPVTPLASTFKNPPPLERGTSTSENEAKQNVSIPPNQDNGTNKQAEYIFAKQFLSMNGTKLGLPVFNPNKELLGFYRESEVGEGSFSPLHQNIVGPREIQHATFLLEEAISQNNQAVHSLKDWGSLAQMLDHAMVYDWSKDLASSA